MKNSLLVFWNRQRKTTLSFSPAYKHLWVFILMGILAISMAMLGDTVETPAPEGMVLIPAGEFEMGSDDADAYDNEKPVHTVYVDAFYMDTHEVTHAEYQAFVIANPQWQKEQMAARFHDSTDDRNGYLKDWSGNKFPSEKANHPVRFVSWDAAMAYAAWAGKRLPTEAEWEKAARGGLARKKYPWGDSITSEDANYGRNLGTIVPVGQYAPNGYGLYDMAGNVWEWCLDEYNPEYYAVSPARNPFPGERNMQWVIQNFIDVKTERVFRGGDWFTKPRHTRCSFRMMQSPFISHGNIGFRCVKPVTP